MSADLPEELRERLVEDIRADMSSDEELALELAYEIGTSPWMVLPTTDNEETEEWTDPGHEGIDSIMNSVIEWLETADYDEILEVEYFRNILDEL
jgi:hypothetical protein